MHVASNVDYWQLDRNNMWNMLGTKDDQYIPHGSDWIYKSDCKDIHSQTGGIDDMENWVIVDDVWKEGGEYDWWMNFMVEVP